MTITERAVLDTLHRRYSAESMGARRFVVAEHVPAGLGYGHRIADFIAQDCHLTSLGRDGRRVAQRYALSAAGCYEPTIPTVSRRLLHGHEVKVQRSDWLRELRDPSKADAWRRYCDRWWLVTPHGVAKPEELPAGWGLIVAGRVVVQAPVLDPDPMPATTRAALLRATQTTAARTTTHHRQEQDQ